MNVKLRDEDRQAIDLLLDGAPLAHGNGAQLIASHSGVSNERIAAAEKVLSALDALPAIEPAQDLLQRTLARIDGTINAPLRGHPSLIDLTRPVA